MSSMHSHFQQQQQQAKGLAQLVDESEYQVVVLLPLAPLKERRVRQLECGLLRTTASKQLQLSASAVVSPSILIRSIKQGLCYNRHC